LGKVLEDCLDSVLKTSYSNFEVLFVDNASTDGSVDFVTKRFSAYKNLRVVQNEKNYGFTEGNNKGIKEAKGKYLAILNNDTKVNPDWLSELVKVAQNPQIAAVQSQLLVMNKPNVLDSAGGLVDYYGYHYEIGRGEEPSKYTQSREVFYGKGASLLMKREVLDKTGLFDPTLFMYFDEVDLCWRILLGNYKVVYAPASVVYHASGSTTSTLQLRTRLYFYTRNHIVVLLKNYNLANAFKAIAVSILFEARNMIRFLAKREPLVSVSIFEALLWNVCRLKQTWKQRQIVQSRVRKVPDEAIRRQMLKPYPPFPLYLLFSRSKYQKEQQ
jgi:hypothetical protein